MGSTVEVSPITGGTVTPLVDASTVAWAANRGFAYSLTIAGNRTLANPSDGVTGALYVLTVTQGAGGSHSLAYGSNYKTPGGSAITLSTDEGATDVLTWFYDADGGMTLVSVALNVAAPVLAPSDLTATTDESGQITLNWVTNAVDATAIRIQFDNVPFSWATLETIAAPATSYVDTPLPPGDRTYRIFAVRGSTPSLPSNTATGTAL